MIITATTIIATIGTLTTYLAASKWLFPYIENWLDRKHNKDLQSLDVDKELLKIENDNNKLYESQILFFIGQIDIYQKQIIRKTDELNEINSQFDSLKQQLLIMQKELFELRKINVELTNKIDSTFCGNENCAYRIKK